MKAVILAAGRGSRMGAGTEEIPKCMLTLFGKTLLERCVNSLETAGFARADIGIVTGYRRDKINVAGVNYFHNADWERTNMFISLTMAEEWLKNDVCIVSYSDIVFSPETVKKLINIDKCFAITYYTGFWELWSKRFENPLDDLETFKISNGTLLEIGKKPSSKNDIQGQYMGLLRFTPSGWEKVVNAIKTPMPKPVERLDMTTLLQHLLTFGYEITAIPADELWLECDNQNDIQVYEKEYAGAL